MSDVTDPQGGEIEVTPEEERFLKRFFRRQALPYLVLLGLLFVAGLLWAGADDGEVREARIAAAVAQVRAENQALTKRLAAVSEQVAQAGGSDHGAGELERAVENARRNVRMIESRVTAALEQRLDSLEVRVSQQDSLAAMPAAPASVGSPPPDASAWDVSSLLDRLVALEMHQQAGADPALAARLERLEQRLARLEQAAPVASAGPVAP
jgi:hypothetical protein